MAPKPGIAVVVSCAYLRRGCLPKEGLMAAGWFFLIVIGLTGGIAAFVARLTEFPQGDPRRNNAGARIHEQGRCGS